MRTPPSCQVLLASMLLVAACGGARVNAATSGPVEQRFSGASQREQVSITLYEDFGLVREIRNVDLARGKVALELRDVAARIQPETVHIQSLTAPDGLTVFEQNYRYDLLTPNNLLEKYVGKRVKLHRYDAQRGVENDFDAEVLAANDAPVFKVNGEISYGFAGRISFPEVPANLITKPTLALLLGSTQAKQKIEVAYLTQGLGWTSDYVLTVDDSDQSADLVGWVTLTNHSGAAYENARLNLVAGHVQRVAPAGDARVPSLAMRAMPEQGGFTQQGFFEYHLYALQRPTTLLNNEQKQVTLLQARGIRVAKKLIMSGGTSWNGGDGDWRRNTVGVATGHEVFVYLDIENRENNHLGVALPKGTVRVYKADLSGASQLIGEDRIDHTSRDEKLRIKVGESFDVVGERKQTSWTSLGACSSESEWEISLRNHKDSAQAVEDVEPVSGDWDVLSSSKPATKRGASTFVFDVSVPARGEVKIQYRVRVRWCGQ
jgi:hypothetical protein